MAERREPYNPLLKSYPDSCDLCASAPKLIPATNYIYFMRDLKTGLMKIGQSWNPKLRARQISTREGKKIQIVAVFHDPDFIWERRLHDFFFRSRVYREWFEPHDELLALIEWLLAVGGKP